jgi:hypothetical protein
MLDGGEGEPVQAFGGRTPEMLRPARGVEMSAPEDQLLARWVAGAWKAGDQRLCAGILVAARHFERSVTLPHNGV